MSVCMATSTSINTTSSALDKDTEQTFSSSINFNSPELSISIHSAQKKVDTGMRIRDKTHCCMFCYKLIQQLARHFEIMHSEEIEVARLLAMPKKSKQRRGGFTMLARFGDYYHNCKVLAKRQGELILVRRPTPDEAKFAGYADYGPCPDCLGFMIKKQLWHHLKYGCSSSSKKLDESVLRRNPMSESSALLNYSCGFEISHEFRENIISKLRSDPISLICKQDHLILKFGSMQFEKYHNTQCELIRQSLRQLARLLMELRRLDSSKVKLDAWLLPEHFDTVVAAVRNVCCFQMVNNERTTYKIPSLALKLGYHIKKCISILMGNCLRKNDTTGYEKLKSLKTLIEMEWVYKISSNALATLYDRKLNAVELLPLTDDLVELNKFLNKQISSTIQTLSISSDYNTWSYLANLLLCKVILFNKRRSGETSRMTLVQYSTRGNWSQVEEFAKSFSSLEKELAKTFTFVQIKGKRGRHVNILLAPDVKKGIDLLIETREKSGIEVENPYIFARGSTSKLNIRGHDAVRKICSEAELVRPDLINGTKLRKYVATVCQFFNLSENETDWLARHLGHDIRVHRELYRLQGSSVELTKVSRRLMVVENGEANKFKGKSLDDININELPCLDEALLENSESENEDEQCDNSQPEDNNGDGQDEKKGKQNNRGKKEKNKTRRTVLKRPWSELEGNTVLCFFKDCIKIFKVPGKKECDECINKNRDILSFRKWTDIKSYVHNHLTKRKRSK